MQNISRYDVKICEQLFKESMRRKTLNIQKMYLHVATN